MTGGSVIDFFRMVGISVDTLRVLILVPPNSPNHVAPTGNMNLSRIFKADTTRHIHAHGFYTPPRAASTQIVLSASAQVKTTNPPGTVR